MERAAGTLEGRRILRLYPQPLEDLVPADVYADLSFPGLLDDSIPYTYLNMVASVDGKAAMAGKASGIGSAADRLLMDNLRSVSDAVMVGAGTLRAEKLTLGVSPPASDRRLRAGLSPQPLAVVVSGSSDISRAIEQNLLLAKPDNTLVIIPEASEGTVPPRLHAGATIIREPAEPRGAGSQVELYHALRTLRQKYGVRRLLVEGGPSINGCLITSGLVREVFVTLAPKLLGSDGTGPESIVQRLQHARPGQSTDLNLLSAYMFESELYLRYEVRGPETD